MKRIGRSGYGRTPSVSEQITRRYYEPAEQKGNLPRGQARIGGNPPMISVRCGDYTGETPVVSLKTLRQALDDFEQRRKLSGNRLTMDEEVMRKALEAGMRAKWAEDDAKKAVEQAERMAKDAQEAVEQAERAAEETRDAAQAASKAKEQADSAAGESSEAATLARRSMAASRWASRLAIGAAYEAGKAADESALASETAAGAARTADEMARTAETMRSDIEEIKRQIEEQGGDETAQKLERIAGSLDELTGMFRYGDAFVRKVGDFAPPERPA